jgi:hypothetical protein
LDFASQVIASSPTGAQSLIDEGEAINPNLPESMQNADPDYPFVLDGEEFRVVRTAEAVVKTAEVACDGATAASGMRSATLVTVTVTWSSRKNVTSPHVASQLFAPHRSAGTGLADGVAVLAVKVSGNEEIAGSTGRSGVSVKATAAGETVSGVTDSRGCALLTVSPGASGADYTVALEGSSGNFINPGGSSEWEQPVDNVEEGAWRQVPFSGFERAASLSVTVHNLNESVMVARLLPASAAQGGERASEIKSGKATFEKLYPGAYSVWAGDSDVVAVTLVAGEDASIGVTLK